MTDITTAWRTADGDWALQGTQLASGDDLVTAMLLSLFTDRRATPDDLEAYGVQDVRGWWADDPAHPIGSRLWLLQRAKETLDTLKRAKDYIAEALQWLIDDQVVQQFDIVCEWTRRGVLGAKVVAYKPDGNQLEQQFAWVWN